MADENKKKFEQSLKQATGQAGMSSRFTTFMTKVFGSEAPGTAVPKKKRDPVTGQ